jgi:hypothetical protein
MSAIDHRMPAGCAFLSAALLTFLLASCRRPDAALLAGVDRLLVDCDSLTGVVNGIDIGAYRRMDSVFGTQRAWFDDRFRDTLDTTSATILGNYHRAMNGPLQELLEGYDRLLLEIDTSRTRLGHLKHDLSAALLEGTAATEALRTESDLLRQWRTNADVLQQGLPVIGSAWDRYHASVDSMIAHVDSIPPADRP